MTPAARLLAAIIAISALTGIGIEFAGNVARGMSPAFSAWVLLAYFTIITNLLMAILFGAIACGAGNLHRPRLLAGAALAMLLVGIIFALLLQGLRELTGAAVLADFLLHTVNPLLVPLYWLAFAQKGALRFRDAFVWALYPLGYSLYALVRGGIGGFYPYPFLDVSQNGWPQTLSTGLVIAIAFVAAGLVVVMIDRMMARRSPA